MVSKKSRAVVRQTKHRRLRNNLVGTCRQTVIWLFLKVIIMYAQIIDDTKLDVIPCVGSTLEKGGKG